MLTKSTKQFMKVQQEMLAHRGNPIETVVNSFFKYADGWIVWLVVGVIDRGSVAFRL